MSTNILILNIFLAAVAVILARKWWTQSKRSRSQHLPPGPRPLPILGNILDIPSTYQWKTFAEWKEKWGDIISVTVLGQRIIVISSVEVATDLLEKRGGIYSDRPVLTMSGELMAWDQVLGLSPYGDRFRELRKLLHRFLGSRGQLEKMSRFHGLEEEETSRFLTSLLLDPEHFVDHIRKTVGAVILKMGYGYQVEKGDDPLVRLVDRSMGAFSIASLPGTYLVDTIPALKWLPKWLPGMAWKRQAEVWRADTLATYRIPFDMAREAVASGVSENNFVADNIGDAVTPQQEYHLKMAAASLYAGGADTTVSAITSFFLYMVRNPEVQKKAQQELDTVIGTSRLPAISDRDNLPYIRALVSEVLRFHSITPLGVPHRSSEDDNYRGYTIPKGSILFANIWCMLRDPAVYSNPTEFRPERFLGEDGKSPEQDPRCAVFGFGRRICPGLNLAEISLFITCAMTLAVFDITSAVEDGKEAIPNLAYSTGTISHPLSFKCSIKPRSEAARAAILELAT